MVQIHPSSHHMDNNPFSRIVDSMNKKIIAIGDLHGHHDQLVEIMDTLLSRKDIDPKRDIFVFLGDYVDGGPKTKEVLDDLIKWKKEYPHWKFLFGNHESLLVDAFNPKHPIYGDYYLWWNQGGKETLESFKDVDATDYEKAIMQPKDLLTDKYMDFIKGLDLYYETDDYFFVHGGLYPNRSIKDHLKELKGITTENMAEGDMAYDMLWIREPFLSSKYDWGKKIIFGHTVFPYGMNWGTDTDNGEQIQKTGYPLLMDNKFGLDTMMHNDGRITALILPDEEFVYTDFVWGN